MQERIMVATAEGGYDPSFMTSHLERLGLKISPMTSEVGGLTADMLVHETAETPLKGRKILVSAGPTRGRIDAVRYISNRSSGKLGIEIAKQAYLMGAEVTLVYGPGTEKPPPYLRVIRVESVEEMKTALLKEAGEADAAILAAAVLDYAPKNPEEGKIRSGLEKLTIELEPTEKVVDAIRKAHPLLFMVGFKLEKNADTGQLKEKAHELLRRAKLNLVVANNLSEISGTSHRAMIITAEAGTTEVHTKSELAGELLRMVGRRAFTTHFHTILSPAKSQPERVAEIAAFGRRLERLGVTPEAGGGTYGNLSMRNQKGFIITGRGVHKGRLGEKDIVTVAGVDIEKREISVEGAVKASSDAIVHHQIYARLAHVNAMAHAHDNLALKWGARLGVPSTGEDYPCGTLELAEEVAQAMKNSDYAVMKNHGVIAAGRDMQEAVEKIEEYHKKAEHLENGQYRKNKEG